MFNPWLALSLKAVQMSVEAQSVVALSLLRLATGSTRIEAAARTVSEKVAATAEAQAAPAIPPLSGHSPHVVASEARRFVKKGVRAKKRRLSKR